jgi:hypothetical protein
VAAEAHTAHQQAQAQAAQVAAEMVEQALITLLLQLELLVQLILAVAVEHQALVTQALTADRVLLLLLTQAPSVH